MGCTVGLPGWAQQPRWCWRKSPTRDARSSPDAEALLCCHAQHQGSLTSACHCWQFPGWQDSGGKQLNKYSFGWSSSLKLSWFSTLGILGWETPKTYCFFWRTGSPFPMRMLTVHFISPWRHTLSLPEACPESQRDTPPKRYSHHKRLLGQASFKYWTWSKKWKCEPSDQKFHSFLFFLGRPMISNRNYMASSVNLHLPCGR